MECDICSKCFDKHKQPVCPSCARSTVYTGRLGQISGLLEKEKLHNRIQSVLKPASQLGSSDISTASQVVELTESSRKLEVERHRSQIEAIDSRLDSIREHQRLLKAQIADTKRDNAARYEEHASKKKTVEAARIRLRDESAARLDEIAAERKRLNHRQGKVQKHTMDGRRKLCIETAMLAGLNLKRRRKKGSNTHEDIYVIAGMPIPDLRELNTAHPDLINASLSHLARLLTTTAHYLAIRLPAEFLPPHAGHPNPAILSLSSSYNKLKDGKIRYLSISKPVPLLAKEDPAIYNNFIEGMVLLAYNIAWLARSQGLTHLKTWEDLCCIGKNVYDLFFGAHLDAQPGSGDEPPRLMFGEFSHASATANLNGAKANGVMLKWDMPGLARAQDTLKSHLLTEMSGAEWEMLDEKEWQEERDDERAVLVGGARWSLHAGGASRMGASYMTAAMTEEDDRRAEGAGHSRNTSKSRVNETTDGTDNDDGTKGWMKLKVRNNAE
ncbi:hypothetical protein CAC42_5628 [Sphaceloma murrayae]|uniref:Autophagy-related protein 14 n=1 Tax=Sphaceloma murrayae TaxID=2082308 RepID=A0A2K1QYP8_9PEZI|nr:hypothetical protein CAC42_5628 [Sphaceloma murrayae]